jgi:hypothetical protein
MPLGGGTAEQLSEHRFVVAMVPLPHPLVEVGRQPATTAPLPAVGDHSGHPRDTSIREKVVIPVFADGRS